MYFVALKFCKIIFFFFFFFFGLAKKYYEDLGNSIVAPLYLLKTTKQIMPQINLLESESEEIDFKCDRQQRHSGGSNNKEGGKTNTAKTVLNFIKSPMHKTPIRRKSLLSPMMAHDNFSARAKLQLQKIPGNERLFEDLFVIGPEKNELKPGLAQFVTPKILHTQGFSNQGNDEEW